MIKSTELGSFIVVLCLGVVLGQRVPPGVSPQHYAGQVNQQYQQVPQQQMHVQQPQMGMPQQQVPIQQQVPVQHQQQQQHVPVQQQHLHQGYRNEAPAHSQQILNAAHIAQEKHHIAEHMEVPIDTSKLSEQELQFHYFKMHDADNNNKLDGCELIKSLLHWHEQGQKDKNGQQIEEKNFKDEELVNLIDPILNVDDYNQDGYIDYPEFIRAQQKAAGQPKQNA